MSAQTTASPGPGETFSTGHGSSKVVSIAEPESLSLNPSPRLDGKSASQELLHGRHRVSSAKHLLGKPALVPSRPSAEGQNDFSASSKLNSEDESTNAQRSHTHHHHHTLHQHSHNIIAQIKGWLKQERDKQRSRQALDYDAALTNTNASSPTLYEDHEGEFRSHDDRTSFKATYGTSNAVDLDGLERILATAELGSESSLTHSRDGKGSHSSQRPSSRPGLLRRSSTLASSDTDYVDGDPVVPYVDAVLDNSKTLSYSGGAADTEVGLLSPSKRAGKEKAAWLHFKNEIVRLAHTLKLKGWRRVPLDRGGDIHVERISGALTNAVYMVSPPANLPQLASRLQSGVKYSKPRKLASPPKLLLRIYGPQVEHLIDRENELQILRRLRRKKIGPNLLGTFTNGRFEQFFEARTLTAKDIRVPQTSIQIAKRMRELHDGVELLEKERDAGPFVWRNWDKWVDRCEEVMVWLDQQISLSKQGHSKPPSEKWKMRGLVCGVKWASFRKAVEDYRQWLNQEYGGAASIRQQLVFAHNDTQYGNLLRLNPPGESPLLIPANEHKQLIVIDFEYASPNLPGLEFANHFSEWCYNYHDASKPYAFNAPAYPTPEEQHRFLKAYIQHRPFVSPNPTPSGNPSRSTSFFSLDSCATQAQIADEERIRDQVTEADIRHLQHDARLWRVANSAMWVAWGIVQAKVIGMDEALAAEPISGQAASSTTLDSDPLSPEIQKIARDAHDKRPDSVEQEKDIAPEDSEEEEFDYLGYSQDRAMFFWGDLLQLGRVRKEDLPAELLEKIKIVKY